MAFSDKNPPPHVGFCYPFSGYAKLLWSYHPSPASDPRRFPKAASHESDRLRCVGFSALLDAVPRGGDDRHVFPVEAGAVQMRRQVSRGSGNVRHAQLGFTPQLCEPGFVRLCRGEVQEEAGADHEEGRSEQETNAFTRKSVVSVVGDDISVYVRGLKKKKKDWFHQVKSTVQLNMMFFYCCQEVPQSPKIMLF